ncbi:RHS repeat protein [Stenotrophomonas sp.]|uniref:RHS repeat protein n=1 Tax=Stenotrophomonas sp. TaxID=69392 RepID=UPI0028A6D65C|nr:RHS repeat protein [Stenotrophomonas sp.]
MKTWMSAVAALCLSSAFNVSAQENGRYVWEEYGKRLSSGQSISPTGTDLFGDQVSLYDGSLSFKVTDISLPGNSALPVEFTRTFTVRDRGDTHATIYNDFPLEDWEIALPNISGQFSVDWISGVPGKAGQRCSVAKPADASPPYVRVGVDIVQTKDFWQGNVLDLGAAGGGELLYLQAPTPLPTDGKTYYWTTNEHVRVSCLSEIQNWPGGGEGFLAVTPDGTRYWFNWMARFAEPNLIRPYASISGSPRQYLVPRARNVLYATRVEDRHGNVVQYTYSNAWNAPIRLTTISSNDGRRIDVNYIGDSVSTVSAGGRTWTYSYTAATGPDRTLSSVTQPDGTQWQMALASFHGARVEYQAPEPGNPAWRTCTRLGTLVGPQSFTGSITHPTGAVGHFELGVQRLGRTNVPVTCENFTTPYNDKNDDLPSWPIFHDSLALKRKVISGPGLVSLTWSYDYGAGYSFYYPGSATLPVCPVDAGDCSLPRCTSEDCAGSRVNTVTAPDGSWTRYVHGNSYRYNEGKLLRVESGKGADAPLRVVQSVYDLSRENHTYPARWGISPRMGVEGFVSEYHRPKIAERTEQQGVAFEWRATAMDAWARPTSITRANSQPGAPAKVETTTYHDNLSRWVVGQPDTIAVNGVTAWQTRYDPTTALPTAYVHFGQVTQQLTYYPDGNVQGVTDGNGNQVVLSSWKRGIPQQIRFPATPDAPAGAIQSSVVNDNGWIVQATDENGFATGYQYDAMGRISQVNYPGGDAVAWNATRLDLARLSSAEQGLAAGHWRHTTTTGTGTKVIYLDALWRPVLEDTFDSSNPAETRSMVRTAFDHAGRNIFTSYPGVTANGTKGVTTTYDALGRALTTTSDSELGPLVTTREYLDAFTTRTTTANGQQTSTRYLAWDKPVEDFPTSIVHPEGARTEIQRDVYGKPITITRLNTAAGIALARQYVYDPQQRLCKSIEPETGATLSGYDNAGNLTWSRAGSALLNASTCDASAVPTSERTVRQYDARNRLTALLFPDGSGDTRYSYTPDGKVSLAYAQNAQGIVTSAYMYNNRRLLTAEAISIGPNMWGIGYGYNANAHLKSHTLPGDLLVDYLPDGLGRATKAGTFASGVKYHPNGAIKSFVYGNGIVHTMDQNARQLPDRSRDAFGTIAVHDDGFDYDQDGNVASISDGLPGQPGNRTMHYDGLDRLVGVDSARFGKATYTYDVLDNLKTISISGGANARNQRFGHDGKNRLTTIADATDGVSIATLAYDPQGNLAEKNGRSYRFDMGNRLREVVGVERYDYDAHGRRALAVRDGAAIYSVYGMDGVLRFQRDERTGKSTQYVQLGGSLIARVDDPIALATPTLLVPEFSANGTYAISWTTTGMAARYEVHEQRDAGSWSEVHNGPSNTKSFASKPAGKYGYRVRACSQSTCGVWSGTSSITVSGAPTQPPTLSLPSLGLNGGYTVTWSAVPAANRYQLQESVDQQPWTLAQDAAATQKTISGRASGTYRYRVNACNAIGCSAFSDASAVRVVWNPATAPTLSVPSSSFNGTALISWTAVAQTVRYELYERRGAGAWGVVHNDAALSRQLNGRTAGTYDYQVRACNEAGCGPYSAVRSMLVTLAPTTAPTLTVPATSNTGGATLSWTAVPAATSYEPQQRKDQGTWTNLAATGTTSATVSGLTSGNYAYRIRACNIGGCGNYSAEMSIQVLLPPTTAPSISAPSSSGTSAFTISWTAVASADSYKLEESLGGTAWSVLQQGASMTRPLSKTNGDWYYRVQACNAGGCGPYSAAHLVRVLLQTPAVPTGLVVTRTNGGEFCSMRWNSVAGATRYRLARGAAIYEGGDLSFVQTSPCLPWYTIAACDANGCSAPSRQVAPQGGSGGGVRPTQSALSTSDGDQ